MNRVMLTLVASAAAMFAVGCAGNPNAGTDAGRPQLPMGSTAYAPRTAAALAFDPPIALAGPVVPLDRAGRAPEAFAGYEQQVSSVSYVRQRDEQRVFMPWGARLERDAYTDRTTVLTR